ncbi:translocation/assembly module TamB [Paraglaciecola aquimarina]|uniref:Translocation/assembly module TamB n=1 Tax=Paraglaciecola algarum TaxID=3050085 RepID=A0ABS9DDG1_9ALTE|nr:translocation/assembly module TamB domain-containing protein [Paraglaciecola sp. G1-23]MCF2949809.1 translocation/assembly module TamB [Paraglaciecola sp. G1-23]
MNTHQQPSSTSQEQNLPVSKHGRSSLQKVIRNSIYSVIGLCLLVIILLITPWGTQIVLSAADSALDELDVEYTSGGLFSELHLSTVSWQQTGTNAKLQDLKFDISLSCLFSGEVCIKSLSIGNIEANITPTETASEPEPTSSGLITMPLPIKVDQISFGQLNLSIKDQLDLVWQSLQAKLSFYRVFKLDTLSIQGLKVKIYSTPDDSSSTQTTATSQPQRTGAFDFSSIKYKPIKSLVVDLPIHFNVMDLELPNVELTLAEQKAIKFNTIELQVSGNTKQIKLQQLLVEHQQGYAKVTGTLSLNGDLQHKVNLEVNGHLVPNQPLSLMLKSSGNLKKLSGDINLSGPFEFNSRIEAQVSNEKLPLTVTASWQDLAWPIVPNEQQISSVTEADLQSPVGQISLTGDLQKLRLAMQTNVLAKGLPDTQLELKGEANLFDINKHIVINNILVQTLDGEINSQGELLLNNNLSWRGLTQLDGIKLTQLLPDYPAELNGELNLNVQNQAGVWQGDIDKLAIQGSWLGYPLSASGKLDYHQVNGLNVQQFLFTNGDNKIELSGSLDQQNALDFSFDLNAPHLSQSVPELDGSITIQGLLKGSVEKPKISYQVHAVDLSTSELKVTNLGGSGDLMLDQTKPMALDLKVKNIVLAGQQIDAASIQISGNAESHQLAIIGTGEQLNLDIKLEGNLSTSAWNGKWLSGQIKTQYSDLALMQAFDIKANWAQQEYLVTPHCWQDKQSQLCIKQAEFKNQNAQWDVSLVDYNWLAVLQKLNLNVPTIQTSSLLNIATKGSWHMQHTPIADFSVSLTPALWTISEEQSVNLDLQAFNLNGQVSKQDIQGAFDLQGSNIGHIALNLQTTQSVLKQDFTQNIQGDLELSGFDLAPFKALLPELEKLQGLIKGQAQISGSLDKPLMNGVLSLENAAIKGENLPISLSEVNQNIRLNGDNADFDGSYKFGKGYGELSGKVNWLPNLAGEILVKGEDLEVNYQDMVKANISPDIKLAFAPQGIDLQGQISVPYARVKIRELPPGSVSPSSDVILVEQQQAKNTAQQKLKINLLVKVDPMKKNQVKLDAYGLTSDLRGGLKITNNAKGMFANGEMSLVNGRYRGNGQNLVIREGDISFNGPLDRPYLNIEAIRDPQLTQDGVIAGMRVQGEAEKPSVEIFSEPAMEQQQSLSYMLTGRGIGESSDDSQDTVITNALLAIGLGQSENLVSKVGNKLGFEDVALDTSGQGDNTQLSLTGTIAPGLQLRYGVGVFDSVSEVAIRYELLPKLYVEAVSGLSNAVDFYYQFSIEGSQNEKVLEHE